LAFVVFLEGDQIAVSLKAENDAKMTGKAVYSQGEIPLTLTREPENNRIKSNLISALFRFCF